MTALHDIIFAGEWGFLRFALLIGVVLSPALGVVGTMVVTRRISSLAGASAHAALGGFGLALFLERVCHVMWMTPAFGAVAGALLAALTVGVISMYAREREDTVIGAVWALGMSIGLLFLDRTPGYVDWQGYLFGNILLLSDTDLYLALGLNLVVLIPAAVFFPALLAISFDDMFARLRGVKAGAIYLGMLSLTALTIVLLINLVGIMLVIALLTLPAAAAGCWTKHLKSMMVLTAVLNAFFICGGLIVSCFLELPSGPAIVVLAGGVYILSLISKKVFK